ncbi:MAG: DUF2834 domain-containing protein [Terricaulis sp.]
MKTNQKILIAVYAIIAVLAFAGTFSQNIQLHSEGGPLGAFEAFLDGGKANAAGRSLAVDIALFLEAAAIFMVIEARRLGVRFVWLYLAGGFLIAISVTFPLFMIAREMRLVPAAKADAPWSLTSVDFLGLALVTALVAAACWYTLT